ncbi:MAG: dihydroorotate dehydrogenase electron transfer subunit [Thermodesulfobacteriota bacterium]
MIFETTTIHYNAEVRPAYYRMGVKCGEAFQNASPGQFVMLAAGDGYDPLLPRPFSIHRVRMPEEKVEGVEILYKKVGRGTSRMSLLKRGDPIRILGPLGNGFHIPERPGRIFVVAGGIGVAPLFFLVEKLLTRGTDPNAVYVFIGGRTRDDILCFQEFNRMGVHVVIATDDGSAGDPCLVSQPVEIAAEENPPDLIFSCGPKGMLDCVARMAERLDIACQVSIETDMACGIGACMGCAVNGSEKDRYFHVCTDGPVFDSRRLDWESKTCSTP